jgi:hypothetical protein
MLRRIVFIGACYIQYFEDHTSIMLISFALFFMAMGIYVGKYLPFKTKRDNQLEVTNEGFFGCHLYMMACYTDFVKTPEQQYLAGWIHVALLAL